MLNTKPNYKLNSKNYTENELFGDYLYALVKDFIHNMAGKFYSVIGDDDTKDLIQDAWLKVLENKDQYDPSKNFEGWVFRICKNFVRATAPKITKYRRSFVTYDDNGPDDSGFLSDKADHSFAADNDIIEGELEAKFQKALEYMSDTERTIVLRRREGYGNSDIAEELGITDGNLRVKKYRADKVLERFGIKYR